MRITSSVFRREDRRPLAAWHKVLSAVLSVLILPFLSSGLSLSAAAAPGSRTVVASESGILLDSDVWTGGGTDQTDAIQAILDKAEEWGRLHFIMDGAALVSRSLRVHSNTTITCPDLSCGFFLADGSDCSVITNADPDLEEIRNRNITLDGGTYNNNSPGQVHTRPGQGFFSTWVFAMEFYGVEHLALRNLVIANQRTFALTMANWKYVTVEGVHVDRRVRTDLQNQDGLHFFGPGRFLTVRNVSGNSGDDFIAVAPDEVDKVSSISDVLIDGIFLDDADQGIRLLCCGAGRLDRVTVRNVSGTYRSFGFIVNPWFAGDPGGGHYGDIVFENINLSPLQPNYTYAKPFLFKIGGHIESLVLDGIHINNPPCDHRFAVVGGHYMSDKPRDEQQPTTIGYLAVRGLRVNEPSGRKSPYPYIDIVGADVDVLSVEDVIIRPAADVEPGGKLLEVTEGSVRTLLCKDIYAPGKELPAPPRKPRRKK